MVQLANCCLLTRKAEEDSEQVSKQQGRMQQHSTTLPWFTVVYGLLAACVALPPDAIVQLGLHIDGIWRTWLGSEGLHFVEYHMRRTIATLITHGVLVLIYALGVWRIERASRPWEERVKRAITAEFRHIDKVSVTTGFSRVTVTDSWILQTNIYLLDIALQSDVDLSLVATRDVPKLNSLERRQMVRIRVTSLNPHCHTFDMILDAEHYQTLSDKLSARIRNSRNLIIRQSLSDQFLAIFSQRVQANPRYAGRHSQLEEDDVCVGCNLAQPNVKIVRRTAIEGAEGDCFCRPMFCLDCIGKWFVSTQDQRRPETWLSGTANCPTCRTAFTVNDLSLVDAQ
ncbi:hypothetical protein PTSG_00154 [Salpingoeca rosetta]|uniref:Uncharacterized protein n=1 Tax=Salpingoeca rosetta (strain ATCC 50818 / BSB-021) TaxID=946362 RepID=F2TVN7_SALR5|nr:uncharacterized protein PTSG_00154 [Salpingoeca rosetta]EGD72133.1 hypothetical protein PTSG_00154 [Salpingoeca rosetta]|eukprot:XP_004998705.1 hypothetical protein PTSG_00154 [Salpingoeca rosetta]